MLTRFPNEVFEQVLSTISMALLGRLPVLLLFIKHATEALICDEAEQLFGLHVVFVLY
jgi:hypothetical protein